MSKHDKAHLCVIIGSWAMHLGFVSQGRMGGSLIPLIFALGVSLVWIFWERKQ